MRTPLSSPPHLSIYLGGLYPASLEHLVGQGEITQIRMTRHYTLAASLVLLTYAAVYSLLPFLLPSGSFDLAVVSDVGIVLLEAAVLVLCWLAFRANAGASDRWVWLLAGVCALGYLFGDGLWAYYELVRQVDVPAPGLPDIGYLSAYALPIGILLVATWKTTGRLRALESTLDAAIFTLGVAGLIWPFIISPMHEQHQSGPGFWVDVAYPILALLLVLAFTSRFFGRSDSHRRRPSAYFFLVCSALLLMALADVGYLLVGDAEGGYVAGSWPDMIWALSFALAGMAAVLGLRAGGIASTGRGHASVAAFAPPPRPERASPTWRSVVPYLTLPVLAWMIATQLGGGATWRWDAGTRVLLYMGGTMVGLLVIRQYVALLQNRRLCGDLADVSRELERRVAELADVNERLGDLNDSSHHLTSLRQSHAVARAGLELACTLTRSPGGWITIAGDSDEPATITQGVVDNYRPGDPESEAAAAEAGLLRSLPLSVRDENLGTMWLVEPTGSAPETTLLPMLTSQLASALDNAKLYEEALQLAERDPLTGLFNHRGIHRRLAGEALRAQQGDYDLSLIMIDLDDFKVLNDTYGHAAGDSVLRQVSDAIRAVLRHADLAGRVGGDEILLVLPNTGAEGAMQLGERLRIDLATRPYVTPEGHSIPVFMSLGVATMPEDTDSLGRLIETADANLYASKQLGGNATTGRSTGGDDEREHEHQGLLGVAGRLLDAVGARDHYTRRHSEHVVRYALSLGEAVGLSEDSLRTLHVAAMLHDVGKIAVPADLLRRPASLAPAEAQLVREHVLIGADVIMDMPRLAQVASSVSTHHERWDGLGYPSQTSGEDIPILGRILAVADAYSAMTLDRPYRKSMTRAQARKELIESAGTQLDPDLVRRFVQILDARDTNPDSGQATAG
jgi:diguanylate cyclase (GGDEF)-like protein